MRAPCRPLGKGSRKFSCTFHQPLCALWVGPRLEELMICLEELMVCLEAQKMLGFKGGGSRGLGDSRVEPGGSVGSSAQVPAGWSIHGLPGGGGANHG